MVTRTLGVKFEVVGFNKAIDSVEQLKKGINQSLKANTKNLKTTNKLDKQFAVARNKKSFSSRYSFDGDYVGNDLRTLKLAREHRFSEAVVNHTRPRINATYGGFYEGIGNAAGSRAFESIENSFRKFLGLEEHRETINLSSQTIDEIGVSVALALRGKSRKDLSQRERNLNRGIPQFLKGQNLLEKAIDQALMPIKTIKYSFFEGIGSNFGNQFAEGLTKVFDEDLDISFERKGQVTGKSIAYLGNQGTEKFKQDLGSVSDNFNNLRYDIEDGKLEEFEDKFGKLVKSISKSVTSLATSYLTGFRKASVKLEALRKMETEIAKDNNQSENLEGKEKVIFTVAGFSGDEGQRGKYIAKQLQSYTDDKTAVVGSENNFTDVLVDAKKNGALWGLSALANVAKINLKGFNPDAVALAAKVVNTLAENPDIKVELLGHSAGGFVVEEAQEILEQLGYKDKVKTKTVATPNVSGSLENPKVQKLMGDGDAFVGVEETLEYIGIAKPTENVVEEVDSHAFSDYLKSDQFLEQVLGKSLDKDKLRKLRQQQTGFKGQLIELETLYQQYVSIIYQELEDLGEELSIAPDRLVAKARRNKLRDRGSEALNRKLERKDFKPINLKEGTETAVLVSGGFSGAKGRSGATFAKQLNEVVADDKTQYVGVRNPFTDVLDAEDIRNPDPQKSIPKIIDMFARTHQKGYNPDAVNIAAQIIDLLGKDPNLKVKFGGYSGGGYIAEDVIELLKAKGVDLSRVETLGVGTPQLPAGIKNREFKKVLGDNDPVMNANTLKEYNNQLKEILGFDIFPELMSEMQNIEGVDSHKLQDYIANSQEVQDFFYGHIPESKKVLERYAEIQALNAQIDTLGDEMQLIDADKEMPREQKVARLVEIKQAYSEILKQIYLLAKRAEKLGGGVAFTRDKEYAAEQLAMAGISVEPQLVERESEIDDPWEDVEQSEAELIKARNKKLAEDYKKYLGNLKKDSKTQSAVSTVSTDFLNLDSSNQKQYIEQIRTVFNAKAKFFRQAVKSGQLEVAREQGEELILLANTIKQLYSAIDSDPNIDPEVKKSLSGYASYATSVQNEIIDGSSARGRVAKGIPETFEEQLNLAEEDGENVVYGFIDGIAGTLVEARLAGEQIVEATEEGIRDRGEIRSPSELARRLGRWFIQGFGLGLTAEDLEQRGREVIEQVAEGMEEDQPEVNPRSMLGNLNSYFDALEEKYPLLGKIKTALLPIAGLVLGGLGIKELIGLLNRLGQEFFVAATAAETLDRAIIFTSRNVFEGARNLDFISSKAKQLGVDLNTAKQSYASFIGAAKNTPLEGLQTEEIFAAFAETASLRGLDQQSTDRLFTALSQIIAKRKITAEEARGQIGDIAGFGDFMGLIAQAKGVSARQLEDLMSRGELGIDILPKIAAILKAQNAMADSTETAQTLQNKYNNSLNQFQVALGNVLMPLGKFILKLKTIALDVLTERLKLLSQIVLGFAGTSLVILLKNVNLISVAIKAITFAINGLILAVKKLWAARVLIAQFAGVWLLLSTAIATVNNVIKLSRNQFPEAQKDLKKLTKGIEGFKTALEEAANSGKTFNKNLPQSSKDLQLGEGAFGVEWLNLDTLARKPINRVLDFLNVQSPDLNASQTKSLIDDPAAEQRAFNRATSQALQFFLSGRLTTQAEKKEADFRVSSGDYQLKSNQILTQNYKALETAEKIAEYDAQIAEIQSEELRLLVGDTEGRKKSLDAQKKIQEQRDKQVKVLTSQQENLQLTIEAGKRTLGDLEDLRSVEGITEVNYNREKSLLTAIIEDAEDGLKDLNDIIGKIPKQLSEFSRQLNNAKLRVASFMEERDRISTQERTQIINQGIAEGEGERIIQLKLDRASQRDIEARIDNLQTEIAGIEQNLGSAALATGLERVEKAAKNSGGLTTDVINRLLEQDRDPQEKEALQGALEVRRMQTQLYQFQEQLAQSAQQSRSALIDFSRTIEDYFFNLIQRISEAQLEVKTLASQIFANNIRNQLKSAIAPGSDSFVNGLIDGIQGVLDQAQSLIERSLGIEGSKIQLESETRSLELEMQDFIKSVNGASDAVLKFSNALGNGSSSNLNSQPDGNSGSGADTITALRRAIIGKESGGNFKAVNPHSGALGYGQVMPFNVASWTKQALGKSLTTQQFLNNADAQIKTINHKLNQYLQRELKATGNNLDLAVRRVASTWYSGQPNLYNNTRPQTYGAGSYPSINDYTVDILKRFKQETGGSAELVSNPSPTSSNSLLAEAQKLNQQFVKDKSNTIELNQVIIEQEKAALDLQSEQQLARQQRQLAQQQREATRSRFGITDRLAEFRSQAQLPTAEIELQNTLHKTQNQFRDFRSELANQKLQYEDTARGLEQFIKVAPDAIALMRANGDERSANFLSQSLEQFQSALPAYKQLIKDLEQFESSLPQLQKNAIAFAKKQGKLRIEAEKIRARSQLQQIKTNIATQRGTSELRRQNELTSERYRLEQRINEIRQQYGDTDYAENLIQLERQNSLVNRQNINLAADERDRSYEGQLLDMDSQVQNQRGDFLINRGFTMTGNQIKKEAAVAQENYRYQSQLAEIEKTYAGDIERIDNLKRKAEELNAVNLQAIEEQFQSLGDIIRSNAQQALETFFFDLFQNINNAGELFRNFVTTVLQGIARIMAQRLAAQVIGGLLGGFGGGSSVATTGTAAALNTGSSNLFSAFNAKKGITVPNYLKGGFVQKANNFFNSDSFGQAKTSFSQAKGGFFNKAFAFFSSLKNGNSNNRIVPSNYANAMRKVSPSVDSAFKREGSSGVLGVFTPGEEILSIKTGEAGRYQALKKDLGIDPLKKVFAGNFKSGGTIDIENNLLKSLNTSSPAINLRNIGDTPSQKSVTNNVTNFSATIVTPDADSFRESQYQQQQDIAEALLRAGR